MYTEIKTKRLLIRSWRFGDEKELEQAANNKKIARNLIDDLFPSPYTLKDAQFWVKTSQDKDKQDKTFAITLDGKIIGGIGFGSLDKDNQHTAVTGYWLSQGYWGKGYATEALNAVTKYAFKYFNVERMEAKVYTWNPSSAHVLEKCGYKLEGTLRKNTLKGGKVVDEWIYSIIRSDLKKKKQ